MNQKYDVVALGELLIDFTEHGISEQGNVTFEANPGGAPCNVLSMLRNLGRKTAFIGKVGNDMFGTYLKSVLEEHEIDTKDLHMDKEVNTTLAFVQKKENGDRDFSFYRNPGADMMLTKEEVNEDTIASSKVFHFGTLSMTHEKVREATKYALKLAKKHGLLISFDPNLREPLWESLDIAKEQVRYGLSYCDILKISDNEIVWLTGKEDYNEGIQMIQDEFQIPLILLSMGKDGSRAYYGGKIVEEKAILQSGTIETTGAGDTFMGCCIHFVLKYGLHQLDEEKLHEMLRFANAGASIITTKKGALRMMPTESEILELIERF